MKKIKCDTCGNYLTDRPEIDCVDLITVIHENQLLK